MIDLTLRPLLIASSSKERDLSCNNGKLDPAFQESYCAPVDSGGDMEPPFS